ncbi:phage fiber-tail adaptor protein [Halovulum sp. GXIMD14793]
MGGYVLKTASSELDWVLSWDNGYLDAGEFVDADLGWRVLPVEAADDLRVISQHVERTASHAVVAGGVPGKVYMVAARVRTTFGRELERCGVIRIAQ